MRKGYRLLDSGEEKKWEQFGEISLCRPCPQAIWHPTKSIKADGQFSRENGNRWTFRKGVPRAWEVELEGVILKVAPTEFGHLGVFPEHAALWAWMRPLVQKRMRILHLFAYSGGATLVAAQEGASVCHVDASKGMVEWARENAERNQLGASPIRWIADEALKFLKREKKRGSRYEGIILDPPTFGRGSKGEVFKIERDLTPLLELCRDLFSEHPRFLLFSCHTPGFTPVGLYNLVSQIFPEQQIEIGEMLLTSPETFSIPSGSFARVVYA